MGASIDFFLNSLFYKIIEKLDQVINRNFSVGKTMKRLKYFSLQNMQNIYITHGSLGKITNLINFKRRLTLIQFYVWFVFLVCWYNIALRIKTAP